MAQATPNTTAAEIVHFTSGDRIFARILDEAADIVRREPEMKAFIHGAVLAHDSLESFIIHRLAQRLDRPEAPAAAIRDAYLDHVGRDPTFAEAFRADLLAVFDRDPACTRLIEPALYFKGFQAIQTHRLAHALWQSGRSDFALCLQSISSSIFQTDIHPAARIGRGVFLDHATGLVVGSTAVIEDNVSMLHGVTLGGTGKERGDRHPKIRHGVLIGAGAKIIGNIEVGHCARIAAGSVVLEPVPHNKTVAGVPARIVGDAGCDEPARTMDQILTIKGARL
ncbi:MAG: serine O-acetyltransferase [Methylocystis sp.]|nr:serine O-acetyltransferase [Methylocystis sp.]MBI3274655.1 serine O-acetyltransferase [Methylocystis sp.]